WMARSVRDPMACGGSCSHLCVCRRFCLRHGSTAAFGFGKGASCGMFVFSTETLNSEQRVLRTPVALFLNADLLPPEIAKDGIALSDRVVAEAQRGAELLAVAMLLQQP